MGQSTQRWYFFLFIAFISFSQSGCMLGYYLNSSIDQLQLLNSRKKIDKVLNDPDISEKTKAQLRLGREVQRYAVEELGFTKTENYQTFVQLDRPYVSWIVSVAHKDKLEYKMFDYAIVGKLPYKGYFDKKDALAEAEKYKKKGYDTLVRGATAYSTLGWFEDPILSSMTDRSEERFVELIFHESAHATIFIEDNADFNEQLASFVGLQAAKEFYQQKQGKNSESLKKIDLNIHDERVFADFIKTEIDLLKKWYEKQTPPIDEDLRQTRLLEVTERYQKQAIPKMKTKGFAGFFKEDKINNAYILGLGTYSEDIDDFEKLYKAKGQNLRKTLELLKSLEDQKDPKQALKSMTNSVH